MSSHERFTLSGSQMLELGARFTLIGLLSVVSSTWSVIFNRPRRWPLRRVVLAAFLRWSFAVSIPRKLFKAMSKTTGQAIEGFCRFTGLSHAAVTLDFGGDAAVPNATLHFVGCQPDDGGSTFLYFHGGGYVDPISRLAHLPFAIKAAKAAGIKNVVFLEYTLAPALKYPGQLAQAAAALNYLLKARRPGDIVIGGDSAGGNLALALMAHMKQPKKGVPDITTADVPLRGLLAVSPWAAAEYSAQSYVSNARTDYLGRTIMLRANDTWGPRADEVWAAPSAADPHFWSTGIPAQRVLLTAGGWEVFRDDVLTLAEKMKAQPVGSGVAVEVSVATQELHAQCIIDQVIRFNGGIMTRDVMAWMAEFDE